MRIKDPAFDFEEMSIKLFQCHTNGDPLGCLSRADNWSGFNETDKVSLEFQFMAWALIKRLLSYYLDSRSGREAFYFETCSIEVRVINAKSNKDVYDCLYVMKRIVDELGLTPRPQILYHPTNDLELDR